MLKTLLRKQFCEIFRNYFVNAKTGKTRSKGGTILFFVGYLVLMFGVIGGMMFALGTQLCEPLHEAGMDWLYFLLFGTLALVLGLFGSVFSTYSSLYLAKDNDLLLSMPIPVPVLMASRLLGVYLMGLLYSAIVSLPSVLVCWITLSVSIIEVLCQLMQVILISLLVFLLSCLLGWVVARISTKLKNRSIVSTILSLVFIAAYYYCYGKAQLWISDLAVNAAYYGDKVRSGAHFLYLFGRIGMGDGAALGIWLLVTAAALILCWRILQRSFIGIATASGERARIKDKGGMSRCRSAFGAVLNKELRRFGSSTAYMLNCGLGTLFLPALGIGLLIKGTALTETLSTAFSQQPDCAPVVAMGLLCLAGAMNDAAAPSVSLEGKSLWVLQSLPVPGKTVMQAKLSLHLVITLIPALFCAVCMIILFPGFPVQMLILTVLYVVYAACFGLVMGITMPNLSWTNEIVPIKQSFSVLAAIFGSFGYGAILIFGYMAVGYHLGAGVYLWLFCVLSLAADLLIYRWLITKGAARFAAL